MAARCSAWFSGAACLRRDTDHPAQAEAVGEHAEARRPERLRQRHPHLATVGERREGAVGLGYRRHGKRERETVEARACRASVGCHEWHRPPKNKYCWTSVLLMGVSVLLVVMGCLFSGRGSEG